MPDPAATTAPPADATPVAIANGLALSPPADPAAARLAARRADVEAKQTVVAGLLEEMGCEGLLLFLPAHVSWFTAGMNVRGLLAETERPGVFTNGRQRWLLCGNVDTQRLFDEELDGLGFQLKEWHWATGRANLIADMVAGRKVAADRPYPNMPLANEKLRPVLRVLSAFERDAYRDLGRLLAHALEATARGLSAGDTEEEAAGQVGHRLLHRGADVAAVSAAADGRAARYRRPGFTSARIERSCVLQATAHRDGLYATAARTVAFGPPPPDLRDQYELALRTAAVGLALSRPDETIGSIGEAGKWMLANTPFEFDWRLSQPGYGTGRTPAEELRRGGADEPFLDGQPVTWQTRVGGAAVVDTVLVGPKGADVVTGYEDWPFKRMRVHNSVFDLPDVLVR